MISETQEPVEGGLLAGLVDQLIESYSPTVATFDVTLPGGEKLPFRRLFDSVEMSGLTKEAAAWAKEMMPKKGKPPTLLPGWEPYYTADPELLAKVYLVAKLAMHPELAGNQLAALILARRTGPVFSSIVHQIDLASTNQLAVDAGSVIENEKKA